MALFCRPGGRFLIVISFLMLVALAHFGLVATLTAQRIAGAKAEAEALLLREQRISLVTERDRLTASMTDVEQDWRQVADIAKAAGLDLFVATPSPEKQSVRLQTEGSFAAWVQFRMALAKIGVVVSYESLEADRSRQMLEIEGDYQAHAGEGGNADSEI